MVGPQTLANHQQITDNEPPYTPLLSACTRYSNESLLKLVGACLWGMADTECFLSPPWPPLQQSDHSRAKPRHPATPPRGQCAANYWQA